MATLRGTSRRQSGESSFVPGSTLPNYPVVILILGAVASVSAIWIRLVYHKFRNTFPETGLEKHEVVKVRDTSSKSAWLMHLGHNLVNLSGFLLPLLLMAAIFELIDAFLILMAFANTAILLITLKRIIRLAKERDSSDAGGT